MEIRRATTADAALLARLNRGVQQLHTAAHPHLFRDVRDDRPVAEWFAALLVKPEASVLIGIVEGAAIGYIAGYIRQIPDNPFRQPLSIGVVDQLAVEPAARGRGYGGQLLDALLEEYRASGVERVELSVWAFNEEASRFYRRRGFAIAHATMALDWQSACGVMRTMESKGVE